MSAPIMNSNHTKVIAPPYGVVWDGDSHYARNTIPGQLWERVAETPTNAPAPQTARQDDGIIRAYGAAHGDRGPLATHAYGSGFRFVASGIIRAGARVK